MKDILAYHLSACLFFSAFSSQVAAGIPLAQPLTAEELKPFCSNQQIWGSRNVSVQRCTEVAIKCSQEIADKKLDVMKANEMLYLCAFDKLGIKF